MFKKLNDKLEIKGIQKQLQEAVDLNYERIKDGSLVFGAELKESENILRFINEITINEDKIKYPNGSDIDANKIVGKVAAQAPINQAKVKEAELESEAEVEKADLETKADVEKAEIENGDKIVNPVEEEFKNLFGKYLVEDSSLDPDSTIEIIEDDYDDDDIEVDDEIIIPSKEEDGDLSEYVDELEDSAVEERNIIKNSIKDTIENFDEIVEDEEEDEYEDPNDIIEDILKIDDKDFDNLDSSRDIAKLESKIIDAIDFINNIALNEGVTRLKKKHAKYTDELEDTKRILNRKLDTVTSREKDPIAKSLIDAKTLADEIDASVKGDTLYAYKKDLVKYNKLKERIAKLEDKLDHKY